MFPRERSSDFTLSLSQPWLRLGFAGGVFPGSPGSLQVHPGCFSKSSWLLTPDRAPPLCPSFPPVRFRQHRFTPLSSSFPPSGDGVLILTKRLLMWTTPWALNPRSDSAAALKPPFLPPPEPPPTGLFLNPLSTDELVATDVVFHRPPPKPPWVYWDCFMLAWKVFDDLSQPRFMFLDKKGLVGSFGAVDTNFCNNILFQFSSNQVFSFDIIETTYSRNELAAVAYLIRNWIEMSLTLPTQHNYYSSSITTTARPNDLATHNYKFSISHQDTSFKGVKLKQEFKNKVDFINY